MRVVIATGGTGGHIYPALALADALKKEESVDILFIGSKSRMESKVIEKHGYNFNGLDVIGTSGNILNKANSALLMLKALFSCVKILKNFKPDIVIGFGNYISVPVILAAKFLKIKTMIHEQNSVAGKANIMLSKHVDAIVGSYEENLKEFDNSKTRILGNPRASEAALVKKDEKLIKDLGLDINKRLVIIVMGSLGSTSVNEVLQEYCLNVNNSDYQTLIVTGENQYDDFKFKGNDNIKVVAYIDGLNTMVNADLIVMRSGATTCAEVTALGKASITIPSPYVPNNHQYINAMTLQKSNATRVLLENSLNYVTLDNLINEIMHDDNIRNELSKNAYKISKVNATKDIIKWIKELII